MNLTLLKKYETLEISKVSEKDQKTLEQVKKLLNNFEETNEAKNKVGEQILDQVIKLNPDAVKKPQVVAQKVAKVKQVAKAKKVTQAKKPATTSTAKTSGNNIMSVAKEIQKAGESWKDAMERAKIVLKERRGQVAEQKKTELEKLLALVRTKKELQGFANSDIKRDAVREAKVKGARFVTKEGSTSNAYGTFPNKIGRKYWETRDRHADRLAPNYPKDMPLLADGGNVDDSWEFKRIEEGFGHVIHNGKVVSNYEWDRDANCYWIDNPTTGGQKGLDTREEVIEFFKEKGFADGGEVKSVVDALFEFNEKRGKLNTSFGAKTKEGITALIENDNYTSEEIAKAIFFSNNKKEKISTGYGDKSFFGLQNMIDRARGKEFANGGSLPFMTDPNFGNFQNTGSFADGGYFDKLEDVKFLFNVGEKIKIPQMENGKLQLVDAEVIEQYPAEQNDGTYFPFYYVRGYWEKGQGKSIYDEEKLLEYGNKPKNSFELGGAFMTTDLAGHSGGGTGGLNADMPLSGVTGTYYTGLVGETGAMSSGELFMDGGAMAQNQQVINDASQSYVNYYLGEGASQGIYKDGGAIKNQYKDRTDKDIWNSFSIAQRQHFLKDHFEEIQTVATNSGINNINHFGNLVGWANRDYEDLPKYIKSPFNYHTESGQYASGGSIPNNYEGRNAENIWSDLTQKQRQHFLQDHVDKIYFFEYNKNQGKTKITEKKDIGDTFIIHYKDSYKLINTDDFNKLPQLVKSEFRFHIKQGQYAYGGKTKSRPSMRELYIEQIAYLTNTRQVGVDAFAKEHNLTDSELSNLMTGLGRKMISQSDFITALVGNKNNPKQKEVVAFAKSDKAYKMADGGFTPQDGKIVYDMDGKKYMVETDNHSDFKDGEMAYNPFYDSVVVVYFDENDEDSDDEFYVNHNYYHVKPIQNDNFSNGGFTPDVSDGTQFMSGVYADGGAINGQLNKKIQKLAEKKGFTIEKVGKDLYNKSMTQALVESLTDANYHDEAKEVVAKAEKKEWSDELYESEYFNPDEKVSSFAREVARECDWTGDDIINAYFFVTKMQGSKVASIIEYLFLKEKPSKSSFVANVEFNVGDTVWQKDEKRYATVMNNYGDPINGDGGDIRLDTSGNTSIFTYDKNYENTGYNLVKLGEKGDTGKFTPEVLENMKASANRLIESRRQGKDKEGVAYYQEVYKRLLDGEFDSMVSGTKKPSKYIDHDDIESVTLKLKGKVVTVAGSDVLNGANILEDGGDLSKIANYVGKNDVVSVELKNGETIKPANGYWVKKGAEPISTPSSKPISKTGARFKFEVGDKVMVDDSGYVTSFTEFDLSKPAEIIDRSVSKLGGKTYYFYKLKMADGRTAFNQAEQSKLILAQNTTPTSKIDENKAHFQADALGNVFVDSNFVNQSQGNLPNTELKHYGYGDFYLQTPDGNIDFIRTSEEKEGFVGRTHKMKGSDELILKLVNAMKGKGRFESNQTFEDGGFMNNVYAKGGGVEDISKSLSVNELYDQDGNLMGYTIKDKYNVNGKYTLSNSKEQAEENLQYLIDNPSRLAYYRKNEYADGGMFDNNDGYNLKDINGKKIEVGDTVKTTQQSGGLFNPNDSETGIVEKTKDAFGQESLQIRYRKQGTNYDRFILLNGKINEIVDKSSSSFEQGGFMNNVYSHGGQMQGNNIDAELEDFDLDNLDPIETMQYNHFVKSSGKVGALQILINSVEGDYTQLSPELAELAEMQMSTEEYDEATREMRFERDGYAKGGMMAKGGMVVYLDGEKSKSFKTKKSLYEFVRSQAGTGVKKVEIDYGNRIIPTFDTYVIEDGKLIHKGELIQKNYDKEEAEKRRVETERNLNKMMGYAKGGELKGKFIAEIGVPYNFEYVVEDEYEFSRFLSRALTNKFNFGNGAWGIKIVKPLFEKNYGQKIVVEIEIPVGVTQGGGLDKFDVLEFMSKTLTKKWFGNGVWGVDVVNSYADGGMFDDNEGFMKADNNNNYRYPEMEVYVETIDEPIDLTNKVSRISGKIDILDEPIDLRSNVSRRTNDVVIRTLDENADLNDDKRVRARMSYNPKDRNPDKLLSVNPRAFEFIKDLPMPTSNTHKND